MTARSTQVALTIAAALFAVVNTPAYSAPTFPALIHNITVPDNLPSRIDAQAAGAESYEPSAPQQGTIVRTHIAYQFIYLPKPGFTGTDTFTVTARDAAGGAAVQTKRVLVIARGAAPYPAMIVGSAATGSAPSVEPVQRVTIEFASGRRVVVP